jgi:hypothetical protein
MTARPSARPPATRPGTRRWIAAVAAVGGALMIGSSFLPWISTGTEDGGNTAITGWGGITGSSGIAGTNLNEVLDGAGTYRPGLIGLIFGVITLIAAIAVASVTKGERPHRITAAVLTLCGLVGLAWGLFRSINPGDAGVFDTGEASAGIGPWGTAIGGAITLAAAVLIFVGIIDPPPPPTSRRSIQPH